MGVQPELFVVVEDLGGEGVGGQVWGGVDVRGGGDEVLDQGDVLGEQVEVEGFVSG